ncbi:MAG TPA: hypothetical protein VMS17_30770 [Gemmataceae bacterium]|nr:hypothetical protein [Gemmataceae bacterium]
MKLFRYAGAIAATVALTSVALAAEALVSGPQVDGKVPGAFEPYNVTGEAAGTKNCLVCQNGENPVVMIFAHEVTPELTKLLKRVDQITGKHKDADMGSFVVFVSNDKSLESQLKDLARDQELKNLVLAIWNDPNEQAGPKKYHVNPDADVTVVLYTDLNVKANHAYRKSEFSEKDIDAIAGEVSKILPTK